MLEAGGALPGHASIVANHLAEANLAGHDSHGFIRIPQYLEGIKAGKLDPKAEPEVVRERGSMLLIDGHSTFGQVVATRATEMAIEKAGEHGISLATMGNLDHTGRIGTYPEMAAGAGMAAIMFTGFAGGTFGNNVAPFGGRVRRLGTNPIAMAFPHRDGAPVLLDFASSMAAEGKLRVYRNKGEELPDAWVLDKDGVPSRDPNAYYEGGAILPVGGIQGGHKGYALSGDGGTVRRDAGAYRVAERRGGHVDGVDDRGDGRGRHGADRRRAVGDPGDDGVREGHAADGRGDAGAVPGRDRGDDTSGPAGERRVHRRYDVGAGRGAFR